MTMKIEVTIPEDAVREGTAAVYLANALSAVGFSRTAAFARDTGRQPPFTPAEVPAGELSRDLSGVVTHEEAAQPNAFTPAEAPKRERGKPAPGKARRTKEEIAEDEAADAANAAPDTAQLAISTGEERIDLTAPEDEAQDAADEAQEAEATKPAALTHDDVRASLTKYMNAYGMPAAMEDGPRVFGLLFGDGVTKVSAIPDDQLSLKRAVDGVEEMLVKNPFARTAQL